MQTSGDLGPGAGFRAPATPILQSCNTGWDFYSIFVAKHRNVSDVNSPRDDTHGRSPAARPRPGAIPIASSFVRRSAVGENRHVSRCAAAGFETLK
ncbi:hypothetical protein EVAR_82298_1 [Eumeta japonica]|uniref:Uncharacterized protein n=1 Tax=Eumeta variegata TaxID=151549 RepID=A0A4C1VX69_EUMVA|nr:hypothetical protein EVAR_82298_1 [Eumeta japonica]